MKEGDVILTIPKGRVGNEKIFQSKNINDMTGQDFLDWLLTTYCFGVVDRDPELFENKLARTKVFEAVLLWWSAWHKAGISEAERLKKGM
jgi:hypothetical protein